jgi:tetratricopeptide (TPR) repeat protein
MRFTLIIALVLLSLFASSQQSITPSKWKEDLEYMRINMKKFHKNLFHSISESEFNQRIDNLEQKLSELSTNEILMEIARIEAAIGDGHTQFNLLKNAGFAFHNFPIKLYRFSDGFYIRAAAPSHQHLIGAKVLSISDRNMESIVETLNSIIASDNIYGKTFFQSYYISMPEVLAALHISPTSDSALFHLEKNGKQFSEWLKAGEVQEWQKGDMDNFWINPAGWVDARDEKRSPFWLTAKKGEKYRMKFDRSQKLLHVQLNEVNDNDSGPGIRDFYNELFKAIDTLPVDKLVLDLRLNGGGNDYYNKPLVIGLIKSRMDKKGKLFVITGRRTFSAAQMLVVPLKSFTNIIQVGEPTASKANHYGDSKKLTLPNSGVIVRVSQYWHQLGSASDPVEVTGPDIYVDYNFDDYRSNRDPYLEAVLHYQPELSLSEQLSKWITPTFDSVQLLVTYQKFKNDRSHQYVDTKIMLRDLGSVSYNHNDLRAAAVVWEINAHEYSSSREWALAGLGREKLGDKTTAILHYKQALQLDPGNEELEKTIRRLSQ